jgi:hypothetical protein
MSPPGRGKLAPIVNRVNFAACCQRDYLIASAEEITIGADDERAGALLDEGRESAVYVVFPAGV